jgi:pimeloyl-ACP methyl ester carboxylesterase
VSIFYTERGSGPPLLFIHGLGESSFAWRLVIAELPGFRCLALDLKGFGRSDKPLDDRYTVTDQAALVVQLILTLDLRGLVMIGHSLGGGVALSVARQLDKAGEDRVRGLVLLDSIAYPQKLPRYVRVLKTPILRDLVFRFVPPEANVRAVLREVYHRHEAIRAEQVAAQVEDSLRPGATHALVETVRNLVPRNAEELIAGYSRIGVPTLIIWGADDPVIPLELGRRLSQDIPGAELRVLCDCGHVPHHESPGEVARLVREFVAKCRPCQEE